MKKLLFTAFITSLSVGLTACGIVENNPTLSGSNVKATTTQTFTSTMPDSVKVYRKNPKKSHYKVIGKVSVNTHNLVGILRQKARINDLARDKAASIGGQAIINFHDNGDQVIGDVVVFNKAKHSA